MPYRPGFTELDFGWIKPKSKILIYIVPLFIFWRRLRKYQFFQNSREIKMLNFQKVAKWRFPLNTVCFFFIRNKVNANFTYLYLIEINAWCLIFSSMLGHLIIYKEIQILIIMLLVKLENLKLVGFQFCRVESRIYCYTKLSIWSHWGI